MIATRAMDTTTGAEQTSVHVFVGPTLTDDEVRTIRPDAVVHPPVEHGDLLALPASSGDVVVIIDGYYHQRAPVRHKEVLYLIDRGVTVIGCASMGALRAAELWPCGMIGYGRIFSMYVDGTIDADDEVAVAHLRGDGYEARNAPLVNIRHACAEAASVGVIDVEVADQVVAAARDLHYTERSWRNVRLALAGGASRDGSDGGPVSAIVDLLRQHPDLGDLKRSDALSTLRAIEDIVAASGPRADLGHWHNPHVYHWLPEFKGLDDPGAKGVSDADVLRYRQIYEPGFPDRWQAFVLDETARALGLGDPEPTDALGIAKETFRRIGALHLVDADNPFADVRDGGADEMLVRTLVRSYQPPRGVYDILGGIAGPAQPAAIRDQVAEARRLNDKVLWRGKVRLVERLSPQRLRAHLSTVWQVADDDATILAAARDRGIPSVAEAVGMIRPYFLRDDARTGRSAASRWERDDDLG